MRQTQGYSREAAVSAFRSFLEFFTTLPALSPSAIMVPPPSGWPNIDANSLAKLGKNEDVIDLLRHLPYLGEGQEENIQISMDTFIIPYNGPTTLWNIEHVNIQGYLVPVGCGELPDYVAVLSSGSRYGSWLLLDTREGTITDFIQQERPEHDEPQEDSPDFWRAYKTRPVIEFFEEWKEYYRTLEWVAVPGNINDGVLLRYDKRTDEVRQIYRDHGWPDSFRREECKEALIEWDKKQEY